MQTTVEAVVLQGVDHRTEVEEGGIVVLLGMEVENHVRIQGGIMSMKVVVVEEEDMAMVEGEGMAEIVVVHPTPTEVEAVVVLEVCSCSAGGWEWGSFASYRRNAFFVSSSVSGQNSFMTIILF